MSSEVDSKTIELAEHMADAAGEILRRYWREPLIIETKSDKSPVTQADREVEAAIRAIISEHFSSHGIIGEEHGESKKDATWQWVIDPIDGTRAFIAGYPIFTTLIALCKNGVPILGIIDQPITHERWLGVNGKTTCNNKPISTSSISELTQARLATTSGDYFSIAESKAFTQLKAECAQTILCGDAYAYAMLALGRLSVVIDVALKTYDFAALKPIIECAGGVITDWGGKPLTLASDGKVIASSNKKLHEQALKLVK